MIGIYMHHTIPYMVYMWNYDHGWINIVTSLVRRTTPGQYCFLHHPLSGTSLSLFGGPLLLLCWLFVVYCRLLSLILLYGTCLSPFCESIAAVFGLPLCSATYCLENCRYATWPSQFYRSSFTIKTPSVLVGLVFGLLSIFFCYF